MYLLKQPGWVIDTMSPKEQLEAEITYQRIYGCDPLVQTHLIANGFATLANVLVGQNTKLTERNTLKPSDFSVVLQDKRPKPKQDAVSDMGSINDALKAMGFK